MFSDDRSKIFHALHGWVRYIETGSFAGMDKTLMQKLAVDCPDMRRKLSKLPVLTGEQEDFVKGLRELSIKVLNKEDF
ncbi:hypothetical protein NVP1121O_209 [Vibrio phage 1.121.O._10N.286.46.C4]|nr:hypothetical protein NVP1121O_209 [Vibrio phage 1.121.O._10N.286.46.C4]